MLKTLIKKEFVGFFGKLFKGKKSKAATNKKSAGTVVLFVALLLFVTLTLAAAFFSLFVMLTPSVLENDLPWFFGAFAAILATLFSLIGSVFATQTQLYDANDNDLLFSLPIPPSYILISRILPLYAYNLYFVSVVLIPAFTAYMMFVNFSFASALSWIVLIITISLVSLAICCLIGRLTAGLTAKFKNNSLMSIVATLVFLVVYLLFMTSAESVINLMVQNIGALAAIFKKYLPTLYWTGLALDGKLLWLLVVFLLNAAVIIGVFYLLAVSYVKIVTSNKSFERKKRTNLSATKEKSVFSAVLYKEWKRFLGSAVYFLNCSLGSILLIIATIALICDAQEFSELAYYLEDYKSFIAPVLFLAATIISGNNCVSAPSISLEGKSLWIIKSLPVNTFQVLKAKLTLHTVVSAPFAILFIVTAGIITRLDLFTIILLCIAATSFVFLSGALGLKRNLKNPDFDWTNESQPVKQSVNVLITMLAATGLSIVLSGVAFGLSFVLPTFAAILIITVLVIAVAFLYLQWIKIKGTKLFEAL